MAWRENIKKPLPKPSVPKPKFQTQDDDWETDTSYINNVDEKQQRFGSQTVEGSGHVDHVDFASVQEKMRTADSHIKSGYQEKNPNSGYGGKYGVEKTMDKNAVDYSYRHEPEKHGSQKDFKKGFGGEHGLDDRAKDKAALGYDYKAPLEKHSSQTDASKGFGGKFGIEKNAQDKSAVGFSHKEQVEKHPSQKDYNIGFGKIGGPKSESNKAVESSDHHMSKNIVEKHPSTISSQPVSGSEGVKNIRARFENIKKEQEEETAKRIAEERFQRNKVESGKVPFSSSAAIIAPSVSVKNGHERQSSPSPPPLQRKEEENADIYENIDVIQQIVQKPTEQPKMINNKRLSNQEETVKPQVIGGMDLSGLRLRKRHDSSDSQNQEESTDEEWGDQKYKKHITKKPSQEEVRSSIKHEPQQQQQQQHEEQLLQSNQSQMYSTVDEVIKCRALYDYDTAADDEISFAEHDIITNVKKEHEQWWSGECNGRSGLFPANYVEQL